MVRVCAPVPEGDAVLAFLLCFLCVMVYVPTSRKPQIFNGNVTGTGFTHVPGGEQNRDKSVLSFHYYCWFFDIVGTNVTNLTRVECDLGLGVSCVR